MQGMQDLIGNPLKNQVFLSFPAHIPPFSAFLAGNSIELRFGCNGMGLRGQKIEKLIKK